MIPRAGAPPRLPRKGLPRPIGRAEMVTLLDKLGPASTARLADRLGYQFRESEPVAVTASIETLPPPPPPPPPPVIDHDTRPFAPIPFWRPAFLQPVVVEPEDDTGPGLLEEDVSTPGASLHGTREREPLVQWSWLWPRLRARLQVITLGRAPDVARLVRRLASAGVVRQIPRRPRSRWPSRVTLWHDDSARLAPFAPDRRALERRLRGQVGHHAVDTRWILPDDLADASVRGGVLETTRAIDPSAPVLVLGDLGGQATDVGERAVWQRTADRLARRAIQFTALVPVPPRSEIAAFTPRRAALPWSPERVSATTATPRPAAAAVLRLASLATVVEPGLLRALRRRLQLDVVSEVEAWTHEAVAAANDRLLMLRAPAAVDWRARLAEEPDRALLADARAIIRRWHAAMPAAVRHAEALIWHAIAPELDDEPEDLKRALAFAGRLNQTASRADAVETRLFAQLFTPALPHQAFVSSVTGAALTRMYATSVADRAADVPAGIDPEALRHARAAIERPPTRPGPIARGTRWLIRQVGARLRFDRAPKSGAWDDRIAPGSPVAWLHARSPALTVWQLGADGAVGCGTCHTVRDGLELEFLPATSLRLDTDRGSLTLAFETDPAPWATASGRDRFGLWADVDILGVIQRFRFIPPGTACLGAPLSEVGRYDRDWEPQDVTWRHGYWFADTPVTQALWQAVQGENPSRFLSPTRPVESVSYDHCQEFLTKLQRHAPDLDARLPSEAEWEYACRAGTQTATWRGDLDLQGDNNAPVLDDIAWYGGNSGHGLEMVGGEDSSGWPEKQYPHQQAATRRVATRQPNPFGLYDLLGNVWEWCGDHDGANGPSSPVDPVAHASGSFRVLRGGCWGPQAGFVRAAMRFWFDPVYRYSLYGFRLARHQVEQASSPAPRSGAAGYGADAGRGRASAERYAPPTRSGGRRGKPGRRVPR